MAIVAGPRPWRRIRHAPPSLLMEGDSWPPETPDPPRPPVSPDLPWPPVSPDPPWLLGLPDPPWRPPLCPCPALASRAATPLPDGTVTAQDAPSGGGGELLSVCSCWVPDLPFLVLFRFSLMYHHSFLSPVLINLLVCSFVPCLYKSSVLPLSLSWIDVV